MWPACLRHYTNRFFCCCWGKCTSIGVRHHCKTNSWLAFTNTPYLNLFGEGLVQKNPIIFIVINVNILQRSVTLTCLQTLNYKQSHVTLSLFQQFYLSNIWGEQKVYILFFRLKLVSDIIFFRHRLWTHPNNHQLFDWWAHNKDS